MSYNSKDTVPYPISIYVTTNFKLLPYLIHVFFLALLWDFTLNSHPSMESYARNVKINFKYSFKLNRFVHWFINCTYGFERKCAGKHISFVFPKKSFCSERDIILYLQHTKNTISSHVIYEFAILMWTIIYILQPSPNILSQRDLDLNKSTDIYLAILATFLPTKYLIKHKTIS